MIQWVSRWMRTVLSKSGRSKKTSRLHPDPADGIQLYTKTGTLKKGGVELPVYRCGRGSTSLESFHNHIVRFIPGTTASDMHYQAYLLEGIARWNSDRARAMLAAESREEAGHYNTALSHEVNRLSELVYGHAMDENHRDPCKYTGELLVVEYLYSQTGRKWSALETNDPDKPDQFDENEEDDDGLDEGFEEEEVDLTVPPLPRKTIPDNNKTRPRNIIREHNI